MRTEGFSQGVGIWLTHPKFPPICRFPDLFDSLICSQSWTLPNPLRKLLIQQQKHTEGPILTLAMTLPPRPSRQSPVDELSPRQHRPSWPCRLLSPGTALIKQPGKRRPLSWRRDPSSAPRWVLRLIVQGGGDILPVLIFFLKLKKGKSKYWPEVKPGMVLAISIHISRWGPAASLQMISRIFKSFLSDYL